jgi:hypothetical protein
VEGTTVEGEGGGRGQTGSHHGRLVDEDATDEFIPEMDRNDEFVVITWGSGQSQHMPAHTVRWLFWSNLDTMSEDE